MELRDYQQDIYNRVRNSMAQGHKSVMVCLPCRSGKSYIMAAMAENCKGEVLILAHRHELLKQHRELFKRYGIKARMESVFTEINHIGENGYPKLVMIDEAHLSETSTYKKVVNAYKEKGAWVVGFTATPQRLSGERLSLYDDLIQGLSVKDLIQRGAIADFDYYAPDIALDLSEVGTIAGEYNNKQLTEVMCKSKLYGDFIKAWKQLANGKQTIAYAVSIKHAEAVSKAFNEAGIKSVEINAKTPVSSRIEAIEQFNNREIQVLVNVGLISEGITLPECECGLLLRPTQSLALFIQQSMRALTPNGQKKIIIDCVGNFQRHGLPDEDREWSLDGKVKHRAVNDNGTYTTRQCKNCFRVFPGNMNICPYCDAEYQVKGRELKQVKDVELRKIQEEEKIKIAKQKKEMRKEVGRARTIDELLNIAYKRGYDPAWAYMVYRSRRY